MKEKPGPGREKPRRRVSPASESSGVRRGGPNELNKWEQPNRLFGNEVGRRVREKPEQSGSRPSELPGVNEGPHEFQMEIERVADDIWDRLSSEAQNALEALEALASTLEESG